MECVKAPSDQCDRLSGNRLRCGFWLSVTTADAPDGVALEELAFNFRLGAERQPRR
jgi:hypothetical protein